MKLFFAIYSFLWSIALLFLKSHKRLKIGLDQRFVKVGYAKAKEKNAEKILLYAASGGEAFLACTFIEKELEKDVSTKSNKIYYTFSWTQEGVQTFQNFAKKYTNLTIYSYFAPFDKPKYIYKALKEISPSTCYILETEIWLGLLYALKRLEIPFLFINARMTEKSFKSLSYLKWLFRKMQPQKVYALSCNDKDRFALLFGLDKENKEKIELKENLKFEQARALLKENEEGVLLSKPIVLFASIRQEEENHILSCVQSLLAYHKDICIIICPKHSQRSNFWHENIKSSQLASKNDLDLQKLKAFLIDRKDEQSVIVWDTFGYLKKLYACADIAFVGGSLEPLGGQNFLEPLAAGTAPYVGKYLDNFLWVFDEQSPIKRKDLKKLALVKQVENVEELTHKIKEEFSSIDKSRSLERKQEIQSAFKEWLS